MENDVHNCSYDVFFFSSMYHPLVSVTSLSIAIGPWVPRLQDYSCSAEEDAMAGGRMACEVDSGMHEMRAFTQAEIEIRPVYHDKCWFTCIFIYMILCIYIYIYTVLIY